MKKLLIFALVVTFSIGTAVSANAITYSDVVRAEDANISSLEAKAASLGLTTEELKAKIAAKAMPCIMSNSIVIRVCVSSHT